MVRVKVCGITNHQDAALSVSLGAHALGFIFAPSPRQIVPEKARDIICTIPPFVKTIGVFVNEDARTIMQVMQECGLDMVQLHGDESPDMCNAFAPRCIKALQVKDESSLQDIRPFCGKVRALVLDTFSRDERGGTGETFDWGLAVKAKALGVPLILAGGLRPSNIQKAVSAIDPYAVDVNSGIEESPGKKDPQLLKELMAAIRK